MSSTGSKRNRFSRRLEAAYRKGFEDGKEVSSIAAKAAEAAEVRLLRNKVTARALTDKQLADEISAVNEACEGGFGEGGGSPGEWWYERADELDHERKRRELESQLSQHIAATPASKHGEENRSAPTMTPASGAKGALRSTGGEHDVN